MLITALRFQTNFNFPTARVLSFRRIQPPQKLLYIYIYVAEGLRCCKPANLRHRVQQRRLFVAHRQIPSLPTTPLLLSFSIFFEKSQERLLLTVVTHRHSQPSTSFPLSRQFPSDVEIFVSSCVFSLQFPPYFSRLDAMVYSVLQVILFCEHS